MFPRNVHGNDEYFCDYPGCSKSYGIKGNLDAHKARVHKIARPKAQNLNWRYILFSFHLKFKHEDEAFQCVECKDKTKFFLNELELLMHNAKFHPIYVEDNYNKEAMQNRNSVEFYQHCLSLPIYVDLTNSDQDKVINCL